jgi:dTDP-4-dehydrorhamnose reductase
MDNYKIEVDIVKVLVLGASGFLGRHVYEKLLGNNLFKETIGTSYLSSSGKLESINIIDCHSFQEFYKKQNPDTVIWAAMSISNEQQLIHAGLRNLLRVIDEQTKLIYVSTDGFFSNGKGNFDEEDEPTYLDQKNPLSIYTNAKLDGEEMIRKEHKNHIIIRTGPLYGKDFQGNWDSRVSALQTKLKANETYERADNLFKTFVHVEDLANAIIELSTTSFTGVLHVGPKTNESYYTFNLKIATLLNMNKSLVQPTQIPIEEAREKGIPLDTSFNTLKCSSLLTTVFREL